MEWERPMKEEEKGQQAERPGQLELGQKELKSGFREERMKQEGSNPASLSLFHEALWDGSLKRPRQGRGKLQQDPGEQDEGEKAGWKPGAAGEL